MLAGQRCGILLSLFAAFSVAASLPLQAQVNGVPPSVTSLGFGGSNEPRGVPPSVTSLGRNNSSGGSAFGANNFFLPANPNSVSSSGRSHHRKNKNKDHSGSPAGTIEPVYIPFLVPYAEEDDDPSQDRPPDDYVHAPGPRDVYRGNEWARGWDYSALQAPEEEPVAAQPSTILIFKDGHQSDVLNYAIVGDALFDFTEEGTKKILLADLDLPATRKVNDDRGVDFQIPVSTARQ